MRQLKEVQQVEVSCNAVAARLLDGSIVTWGHEDASASIGTRTKKHTSSCLRLCSQDFGGDSRAVQSQLVGIIQLRATCGAFAALRFDGNVVAWGDAACGGASGGISEVHDLTQGVSPKSASSGDATKVCDKLKQVLWRQLTTLTPSGSAYLRGFNNWGPVFGSLHR